jgi:hypothetical protein
MSIQNAKWQMANALAGCIGGVDVAATHTVAAAAIRLAASPEAQSIQQAGIIWHLAFAIWH